MASTTGKCREEENHRVGLRVRTHQRARHVEGNGHLDAAEVLMTLSHPMTPSTSQPYHLASAISRAFS
jgi:hypothetical protein